MTCANIDLYRVLRGLGASEAEAERASAEGPTLRQDFETLRVEVRSEFRLAKWMIGANIAVLLVVFGRLFGLLGEV